MSLTLQQYSLLLMPHDVPDSNESIKSQALLHISFVVFFASLNFFFAFVFPFASEASRMKMVFGALF